MFRYLKHSLFCIIFPVTMLFVLSSCGSTSKTNPTDDSTQEVLTLTVVFDKEVYRKEDPIQVTLMLLNAGSETIIIKRRLGISPTTTEPDVKFTIDGPSGQQVSPYGIRDVVPINDDDFISLRPSEQFSNYVSDLRNYFHFDDPGTYLIRVTYYNEADPNNGHVAWKGQVESDVITITIEME